MWDEEDPRKVGIKSAKRGARVADYSVLQSKRVTTAGGEAVTVRVERAVLKSTKGRAMKKPIYRVVASHGGKVLGAHRTLSQSQATGEYRRLLKKARGYKPRLTR